MENDARFFFFTWFYTYGVWLMFESVLFYHQI